MALKPPGRWGTRGPIGNGLNRGRARLSEALVTQTYGAAADGVITDNLFPASSSSTAKTGTVTGSATTSGTIVGAKAVTKTVSGSATTSGTIVGKEGDTGAVSGSATTSGTVTGKGAHAGAVAGLSASSGTVTGTAYDPSPPVVVAPPGGMSAYRRAQIAAAAQLAQQQAQDAEQAANTRGGTVHGACTTTGQVRGNATRSGRCLPSPAVAYRADIHGSKSVRGSVWVGRRETRGRITGDSAHLMSSRQLRQMRDDAELLLLI